MKRVLASVLIIALMLCAIPFAASAKTARLVETYGDLIEALNDSNVSEVIIADTIDVSSDIDGKGKTITALTPGTNCSGVTNTNASNFSLLVVNDGVSVHDLTIKGGSETAVNVIGKNISFTNVTFTQCGGSSAQGGAFSVDYNGSAVFRNCNIIRNVARCAGGFYNKGTLVMDGCTVAENRNISNWSQGGGACENSGCLYLNNCTFANNQSTEIGGAINNYLGCVYMLNSTVTGNVSYDSKAKSSFGGGIGNNSGGDDTGVIRIANSIITNNYVTTDGQTYTKSDIGEYKQSYNPSTDVKIYNSIVGSYRKCDDSEGNPQVHTDCSINSSLSNEGIFAQYRDANLLKANGEPIVGYGTVNRPIIVKQAGDVHHIGLYTAPLAYDSTLTGASCYFDYSYLSNIKMGTWSDSSITALTTDAPDASKKVTAFEDTTTRNVSLPGAAPKAAEGQEFITVFAAVADDSGAIDGLSVFGETFVKGATVNLKAVPSDSFSKWQTSTDGANYIDVEDANKSTYQLTVNENMFVKSITHDPYNNPYEDEGNNTNVYEETSRNIAVWGKICMADIDTPDGDDVSINVNIAWGSLKYDYKQSDWNATTLKYDTDGWTPVQSGVSDKVTVTNRSNVAIDSEFYFANYGSIDEKYSNINESSPFFEEQDYSNQTPEINTLESAVGKTEETLAKVNTFLKISGKPTDLTATDDYEHIGTITVTIAQHVS